MARIVASLTLITTCGAIQTETVPGGFGRLGQIGKMMTGTDGSFGADVAAAEAVAVKAREDEAAAIAAASADAEVSMRQFDAYSRHAESQIQKEEREKAVLDKVIDSMGNEVDAEARAVEDLERKLNTLEGTVKHDLGNTIKTGHNQTGLVWIDDKKQSAFKREQKAETKLDKELAREEGRAARLMANARKQVDSALAKEKMYMRHRPAMELGTQKRLAQEADALRQEAIENGTLSEDEARQLLDITTRELDDIIDTLAGFAMLKPENFTAIWIEDNLDHSRLKCAAASAKMLEAVKHKVYTFKNNHLDYDDHQFLALLARVLSETMAEIRIFEDAKDYQMTRLQHWDRANGEKLTLSLAGAIQGVTGSVEFRSLLAQIDTARLVNARMGEACDLLGHVVNTTMAPAYQSLVRQKEKLDGLSRIVPSVTQEYPTFVQDRMAARAAALLDMAYVEHLALREAATSIMQEASPVVLSRLRCTTNSGSTLSRSGVIARLRAWLAQ